MEEKMTVEDLKLYSTMLLYYSKEDLAKKLIEKDKLLKTQDNLLELYLKLFILMVELKNTRI